MNCSDTFMSPVTYYVCVCETGRPAFTAKDRQSAENFFIKALDKWRERMGLKKVVLMGHSMGGYLAATYALQHPDRVQHLVLVCPAGIVSSDLICPISLALHHFSCLPYHYSDIHLLQLGAHLCQNDQLTECKRHSLLLHTLLQSSISRVTAQYRKQHISCMCQKLTPRLLTPDHIR